MKNRIRAVQYIECSALKQERLQDIFIEAIRAASKNSQHKPVCHIL